MNFPIEAPNPAIVATGMRLRPVSVEATKTTKSRYGTGKNGMTLPMMLVTKMPSRGFVLMSWLRLSMRSAIEGHGSFASG